MQNESKNVETDHFISIELKTDEKDHKLADIIKN